MAMSTVAIHIFGDVPSSPLVGVLQDSVNNWRETALILTSILFLAAGIWFIGVCSSLGGLFTLNPKAGLLLPTSPSTHSRKRGIFLHGVDRFNEESEHHATRIDKSNTTPLLEDKTADTAEASA
ncbi:putative sphingolipid transporter spinster-like 2 [Vitis vinifera]|uniref:Putative sphingolipid transporter spinster-like 2 n=1 Tax=Vitis vinifera TaxID=29760 RepID=A0A438JMN7_VITVI|nr:putative sphingolipid transporter spinster-like 2 [Vitis vinifera]